MEKLRKLFLITLLCLNSIPVHADDSLIVPSPSIGESSEVVVEVEDSPIETSIPVAENEQTQPTVPTDITSTETPMITIQPTTSTEEDIALPTESIIPTQKPETTTAPSVPVDTMHPTQAPIASANTLPIVKTYDTVDFHNENTEVHRAINDILTMLKNNKVVYDELMTKGVITKEDVSTIDSEINTQESLSYGIILNKDMTEIYIFEQNNDETIVPCTKFTYEVSIEECGYIDTSIEFERDAYMDEVPSVDDTVPTDTLLPSQPIEDKNNENNLTSSDDKAINFLTVTVTYNNETKTIMVDATMEDALIIDEALKLFGLDKDSVSTSLIKAENEAHVEIMDKKEEEATEYVTITINYRYETDDTQVFRPYVATLEKGAVFQTTVDSPIITGYTPFITDASGTLIDGSRVIINFEDGVQNDATYTVYYKPSLVNYTVHYFFQNIKDNNFTEDYNEYTYNLKGYTGDFPDEQYVNKTFEGFTALMGDMEAIAADGSSEYEVYYERNMYNIFPDLNGGYGVEPIYDKYQSSFMLNDPIKAGYVFMGWDINGDGAVDEMPSTIPAYDMNITAIYEAVETTYTVAYWKEDPNNEGVYNYITDTQMTALSSSYVNGVDNLSSLGAEYADIAQRQVFDHADQNVLVNGDGSSVVNVYYKPKEYELRFIYARKMADRAEYEVVGGSTWRFGYTQTNDNMTLEQLLANVAESDWGKVQTLPMINDQYTDLYGSGSFVGKEGNVDVTYYYVSFKGKYMQDISDIWLTSDRFDPVKIVGTHEQCPELDEAYFAGWNGERRVLYTVKEGQNSSGNQTIKGTIQTLNDNLLFDLSRYDDSDVINYLGFWDNGAEVNWSKPILWIYEIYVPQLNPNTNSLIKDDSGNISYDMLFSIDTNDNATLDKQTAPTIDGYTYQSRVGKDNPDVKPGYPSKTALFYYERNQYTLHLTDINANKTIANVYYGSLISALNEFEEIPPYPDIYEEGAYVFDGWYTSPLFAPSTKIDLESYTMPSNDATLYAHWVKAEHTVEVYEDFTSMEENGDTIAEFTVSHRNTVNPDETFEIPTREGYTFNGWFFINERGEKKLFSFNEYPIISDMKIYADWTSNIITSYTVQFKVKGTEETVATDRNGRSFAGNTLTFYAKHSEELFEAFQKNYYPTVSSHSILMGEDGNDNVYTFYYEHLDNVPYTVEYVNVLTGNKVLPDKVVSENSDAVVTEKFEFVNGMIPDMFYKSLTLSADFDSNVITFYYTPDTQHARYNINYYLQSVEDPTIYSVHNNAEGIGNIGSSITAPILDFSGYTFNTSKSTTDGVITAEGLELNLYYDLNEINYTVQYVEYATDKMLSETKIGSGYFNQTVTESAIDIDGYEIFGTETKSLRLSPNADANVITFYYRETIYEIGYEIISDEPCVSCSLSFSSEMVNNIDQLHGSKAIVEDENKVKFIGWYADEEGNELITEDAEFTPSVAKSTTYYAHFKALHTVTYQWNSEFSNIDGAPVLPTDETLYFNDDKYEIDDTYKIGDMIVLTDDNGEVIGRYIFSGWITPSEDNIINKEDVVIEGHWVSVNINFTPLQTGGDGWTGIPIIGSLIMISAMVIIYSKNKDYKKKAE